MRQITGIVNADKGSWQAKIIFSDSSHLSSFIGSFSIVCTNEHPILAPLFQSEWKSLIMAMANTDLFTLVSCPKSHFESKHI